MTSPHAAAPGAPIGAGRDGLTYLWLFLAAASIEILAGANAIGPLLHGELFDPDSFMRLVRIEQGLKLGHLVNIVQRDDSGIPLVVEWSRLFDALIVALAAPLAPLIGWHRALAVAGIATGPISTGLLGASLGFAVAPLTNRRYLWAAALAAPLVPGIREFATLGVIHYHVAQVASVGLAAGCALRAAGGDRAWAIGAGVAGAFAIWLMPETMPWVLLAEVGLGWAWLFRPIGGALVANGAAFFAVLVVALAIDSPHGGALTVEIDRLSIVYAALGVAVFVTTLWLAMLDRAPLPPARRAGFGIAAAAAAFGLWLACYPAVALGPYALMSPEELRAFFGHMTETQPVHDLADGIALLGPGCIGLAYAGSQVWRNRKALPVAGAWGLAAFGILFAMLLTGRFEIFEPYPAGFAAALLPPALAEASRRFATRPRGAAVARVGLVASLTVIPAAAAMALTPAMQHQAAAGLPSCGMRHIAPLLAPAAARIVLTRTDYVPELLYRSDIVAVGSLYQHGIGAFLRAQAAWRAPSGGTSIPAAVAATGAEFVLFCPAATYDQPPDSLWTALRDGRTPAWLSLVGEQTATGFRLYRIVR